MAHLAPLVMVVIVWHPLCQCGVPVLYLGWGHIAEYTLPLHATAVRAAPEKAKLLVPVAKPIIVCMECKVYTPFIGYSAYSTHSNSPITSLAPKPGKAINVPIIAYSPANAQPFYMPATHGVEVLRGAVV
jgi:hypothetical protein